MCIYSVRKIINLRLFPNQDHSRNWDKSVKDLNLEILCVSQVSCVIFEYIDFYALLIFIL